MIKRKQKFLCIRLPTNLRP